MQNILLNWKNTTLIHTHKGAIYNMIVLNNTKFRL